MNSYDFDWSDLAFGSKKPISSLRATFIAAPRQISTARLTQLIKEYLPIGNIILGIAKEDYIDGFLDQPQFKTLKQSDVQTIIDKVNSSASPHKITILRYFQRELVPIVEKIKPVRAIFINGSWHFSFHTLPIYYALTNLRIPYSLISPFTDEAEAKAYEQKIIKAIKQPEQKVFSSGEQVMSLVDTVAKSSFDYGWQTGLVLAKKTKAGYEYITSAINRVVPYQTYAMHHGASRELNFSPPNDLNHYDTIHAEMELIVKAQKENIDLKGTTLFINLIPCPTCARSLCTTDIEEYVYANDHSNGYAAELFQKCGKKVKRTIQ
jgi:deoxycytidylate deaminase